MATIVTDPALLARLNAPPDNINPPTVGGPSDPPQPTIVTDPRLLARLNAPAPDTSGRSAGDTLAGYGKSIATAGRDAQAYVAGAPVGFLNALADGSYGALAWGADKLGQPGAANAIRNSHRDIYNQSPQAYLDAFDQMGIPKYEPKTPGETAVKDITTNTLAGLETMGLGSVASTLARGGTLLDAATAAAPTAGKGAIGGAGASVGSEAGSSVNRATGSPIPDEAARVLGGMALGGGATAATESSLLTPRVSSIFDKTNTPKRVAADYGAPPGSVSAAQAGQADVTNFIKNGLDVNGLPSFEEQGGVIRGYISQAMDKAIAAVNSAYDNLGNIIPKDGRYSTTNTTATYRDLMKTDDPRVRAFLQNDTIKRLDPLFGESSATTLVPPPAPNLSWSDMDHVRKTIGALTTNPDGEIRGIAKQLYKSITEDQSTAASSVSGGGSALEAAKSAIKNRQDTLDDLATSLDEKANGTIPKWLMANSNTDSGRLKSIFDVVPPEQQDSLARTVLANGGLDKTMTNPFDALAGNFNPGKFRESVRPMNLADESRQVLTRGNGTVLDKFIADAGELYDKSSGQRDLLARETGGSSLPKTIGAMTIGTLLGSGGAHLLGGSPVIDGLAGLGGAVVPPLYNAAKNFGSGAAPNLTNRLTTQPFGSPSAFGQGAAIGGGTTAVQKPFDDVYTPPQMRSDAGGPADTTQLGNLPPDVQQQISEAGANGRSAALMAISMNPNYRRTLNGDG